MLQTQKEILELTFFVSRLFFFFGLPAVAHQTTKTFIPTTESLLLLVPVSASINRLSILTAIFPFPISLCRVVSSTVVVQNILFIAKPSLKRIAARRNLALGKLLIAAECEGVVGLEEGVGLEAGVKSDVEIELDVGDSGVELGAGDEPPAVA